MDTNTTQTTETPKPKSDVILIKEFFGMDNTTALKEIKALSANEKAEIVAMVRAEIGLPALEPVQ